MKTFWEHILKLPSHPHILPLHFPYFDLGENIVSIMIKNSNNFWML